MTRHLTRICAFVTIFIVFFLPELQGAKEVNEYFSAAEIKMVKKGAILTRARVKGVGGFNRSGKDSFTLPRSSRIPPMLANYEVLAEERAFIPFDVSGNGLLRFYNSLFAFSRFAGSRYYSKTEKALLPYLLESSVVDGASAGKQIPDPLYRDIRAKRTRYYRVRDNRFGEIVFRGDIYADDNGYCIDSGNTRPLKKFGFTIAEKEEFRTLAVFIHDPREEGFFYYSLHAIRVHNGFFASTGLLDPESFANRIRAETVRRATILGLNWNSRIKP